MNVNKIVVIAIVALMSVPAAAYATQYTDSKANQRLVEGHTSYAVLVKETAVCDSSPCPPQKEEGTALAVLTSENECVYGAQSKVNGVLWFNDQFLVGDDNAATNAPVCTVRYPCAGTVYVTLAGLPDPLASGAFFGANLPSPVSDIILEEQYIESYKIMDPNNNIWVIDLWRVPLGQTTLPQNGVFDANAQPVWTINVLGAQATIADGTDDTGAGTCAPLTDSASHSATANTGVYNNTLTYPTITYNALLFMRFKDLVPSGVVEYGYDPVLGANGMEETTDGNSHPWNNGPTAANASETHTHETALVDVYYTFHGRPQPAARTLWIDDNVGSTAPFHTHS